MTLMKERWMAVQTRCGLMYEPTHQRCFQNRKVANNRRNIQNSRTFKIAEAFQLKPPETMPTSTPKNYHVTMLPFFILKYFGDVNKTPSF